MKEYRIPQKENVDLEAFEEPSSSFAGYSYADYLKWDYEEIVELIKGKIFAKAAAPNRRHQEVSGNVFFKIFSFLKNHSCKVYSAPFDVRFSKDPDFSKTDSVVQPDISVICDPSKLDDKGCWGAPDLIVEILSPGNSRVELQNKYDLYQEYGVREYWVIHPSECTLLIYTLINGGFQPSRLFTFGDRVTSAVIPGFKLDLEEVFRS
ncbi:Endonuclease, Uma2 family (restriction endonuclease fold) [Algoriphagus locisalis]|uniref:Endonuclease, Uma2 family (Restriction endonuclease fold) n=1 Tax=Algoriphagus locisalis TaxID=305507 RepID=A0A1I7BYU9_9BACT|nr:Uma2 family endonuclease [Algoriphagus locisalis]SFT92340.1 Endonuclease, Uma2 family (restriction endonuclease fold) [Algoriphagus locisalis]